jgi:hypothetical protein
MIITSQDFDAADHCYEKITISYGGKSAEAQIVDMVGSIPANPPYSFTFP